MKSKTFPVITPQTTWSIVRNAMGKNADKLRPIVNESGSAFSPFNASLFYVLLPGCIFEVFSCLNI
jgi:hypothetical protein